MVSDFFIIHPHTHTYEYVCVCVCVENWDNVDKKTSEQETDFYRVVLTQIPYS